MENEEFEEIDRVGIGGLGSYVVVVEEWKEGIVDSLEEEMGKEVIKYNVLW